MPTIRKPLREDASTGIHRARYHLGKNTVVLVGAVPFWPDPEREWAGALMTDDSCWDQGTKALSDSQTLNDLACFSCEIFSSHELVFVLRERDVDEALDRIAEWQPPSTSDSVDLA